MLISARNPKWELPSTGSGQSPSSWPLPIPTWTAARRNRDLAFEVNCKGAVNVVRAAERVGAQVIFLSSDYVFSGSSSEPYEIDDPLAPQSVYGESKAAAEIEIRNILPQCCILRTSWVFGTGGKCFPETILKLASSRTELEVVNDQRGCPTYTIDLARAIIQLCRKGATGTVHATNRGDCTWFDFASADCRLRWIINHRKANLQR